MSKYELAVVVSAKLEDDARAEVIEKVKALVTRFGGNITDVDEWGKKRLAYEIQKMKEAYYYFIHFESETTTPGEIEERIRIMDGVKVYTTEVVVEEQEFAESKNASSANTQSYQTAPAPAPSADAGDGFMNIPDGIDEELPFN